MIHERASREEPTPPGRRPASAEGPFAELPRSLEIHLRPRLSWDEAQATQRRLVYELGEPGGRRLAVLVTEHEPIVTIGRHGDGRQVVAPDGELSAVGVDLKWVSRGGRAWLHQPGQLVFYLALPVPNPAWFGAVRKAVLRALLDTVEELRLVAWPNETLGAIECEAGTLAGVGLAMRDGVIHQGGWLNVNVRHDWLAWLRPEPGGRPATSLLRETRSPIRMTTAREAFTRKLAERLGVANTFVCPHTPESARRRSNAHVLT